VTTPEEGKPPFDTQADRESNRTLWGIYSISFDIAEGLVEVRPLRAADAHYEITDWLLPPECYDCLAISINSFDPVNRIIDVDAALKNPTGLTAYDVRGILYTNDYGHELRNADALTGLWDIPGGEDINPFMAFAKSESNREFIPAAKHTENYLVYIPDPPHWNDIIFAVDVSWPGNCKEPYGIENFLQAGVLYDYSTAAVEIQIDVFDWQDDVTEVSIYAPELTGEPFSSFTFTGGNTWSTELVNTNAVEAGEYQYLIAAQSSIQDVNTLYKYCTIEITEYTGSPDSADVTPPWLNFTPRDIAVQGDYAYVASDVNGLHVFDISEPSMPVWAGRVETDLAAWKVIVQEETAYVLAQTYVLYIIDITFPEASSITSEICIDMTIWDFDVGNGYVYFTSTNIVSIFDVDPPDTPVLVKTIETMGSYWKISHHNSYVYVYAKFVGLGSHVLIIDVDPPESASIVNEFEDTYMWDLVFQGDYAYTFTNGKLTIIDVSSPESAVFEYMIDIPCFPYYEIGNMAISGDYIYLSCNEHEKLCILDISTLGTAELVHQVDTIGNIAFTDGYAYTVYELVTLDILNIEIPESAFLVDSIYSPGYANNVHVSEGYAYVMSGRETIKTFDVIDIDPFSEMEIVRRVPIPGTVSDLFVSEGYAYVTTKELIASEDKGFIYVIDIETAEDSYIYDTIEVTDDPQSIKILDGNAYMGEHTGGFQIIDVTPPEASYIITTIEEVNFLRDFEIRDGYAFITNYRFGVIDVDPPESAHLVNYEIPYVDINRIAVYGDHAFTVGSNEQDMYVYDISDPEDADQVATFSIAPWYGWDVAASGDYVLVSGWQTDGTCGILKLHVNPVDSIVLVETSEIPEWGWDIFAYDNFLYVADDEGGLRIISLE